MKLEKSFDNFLKDIVNLNETRYKTAKSGIETMTSVLQNDCIFGDKFIDTIPQGSFRQETIIRPTDSDMDFDVDILFEMDPVEEWDPADYLEKLSAQFKKLDRYKDKVDTRGKTRCVTIDYESDFHIDIIPTIKVGTNSFIMNKETNNYEPTDGDGYAQWFYQQNEITGKKYLTKTIRLLKYIRDSKKEFDVKSIFLTTLIGNQVLITDNANEHYIDLPTTFTRLLLRLDKYLQSNPSVPQVRNPVLQSEVFNRHMDQMKYSKFRESIHNYSQQALDAYKEKNEVESSKKWQQLFGDSFVSSSQEKSLAISINGLQLSDFSHKKELSDLHIPSVYTPAIVKIEADLYWGRANDREMNRRRIGSFSSKTELKRFHWLKYKAVTSYEKPYDVYWQVVNTGKSALQTIGGLRGEIKLGTNEQWERSLYTGVHWIECFIVDQSTKQCVCRSGPFYVGFRERPEDMQN
ncbi:MAG: nucleotidyltransferase [Candidatus Moranbacteria bacterium]|nr:nucleotidyltransferase [Candidatus Moranbacteria bacterium]